MKTLLLQVSTLAVVSALAFTPIVRAIARRYRFIAPPRADRWHGRETALMGGVAIFAACLTSVSFLATGGFLTADSTKQYLSAFRGIALSSGLMFVTGILDDIWRFRPATKIILQLLAAVVLVSAGVALPLTPWAPINTLATIFWFLGVTNALNLLDNMDGVAVGVAAIAAIFLAVTFGIGGNSLLAPVCVAVAGACLGFLPYNFKPASIFMGDSGSLFLGSILAGLAAAFPATVPGSLISVLFVPASIVIIPLLDTTLVTITRTMAGRRISVGGRDHTSHRLVALGLSERQAAGVLYAFAFLGGMVGLAIQFSGINYGLWLGGVFLVVLSSLAKYLAKLHTYPTESVQDFGRFTVVAGNILYKGKALELLQDVTIIAVSYLGAFILRYDGVPPARQVVALEATLGIAILCYILPLAIVGAYKGSWHQAGIADYRRMLTGCFLGLLVSGIIILGLYATASVSRSVIILTWILATTGLVAARASFRLVESLHLSLGTRGRRTLIYGAGKGGELIAREISANPELNLKLVGFVDDDYRKVGTHLQGVPVLGDCRTLGDVVRAHKIAAVIVATQHLRPSAHAALVAVREKCAVELMSSEIRITQLGAVATPRRLVSS